MFGKLEEQPEVWWLAQEVWEGGPGGQDWLWRAWQVAAKR